MENAWLGSNTSEHWTFQWITNWLWVNNITWLQNKQTASWCTWGKVLPLSQMKKGQSVSGNNKHSAWDSTSNKESWPTAEWLEENCEGKKKSVKHDLCYEKRVEKMGLFSTEKRRLKWWTQKSIMKFNKGNHIVLHLGRDNATHQCNLGADLLESRPAMVSSHTQGEVWS